MDKNQWQNLYDILNQIYSDFYFAYSTSKEGKNKKIRSDAARQVDSAIRLADFHIRKNWEAFELLTDGKETSGFGRAIIYDEFVLPRYFGGDLSNFLNKIKEKIKSLN